MVGEITKDDILNFRSVLAKAPGRKKNVTLAVIKRTGVGEVPSLETLLVDQADRWSMQNDAVRKETAKTGINTQPAEPGAQSSGAQSCRS